MATSAGSRVVWKWAKGTEESLGLAFLLLVPVFLALEAALRPKVLLNGEPRPSNGQQASQATEGFCVTDDCWSQALGYIITFPIFQFISSLLRIQHAVILLRSVLPEDKSIALGMFEALICIFGLVPYLITFGSLVDSTCLVWEKSCGEYGNCWFYDTDKFSNLLHALSAVFSSFAALSLVATYFLSGRIGELYEDDNDGNESTNKKELEAAKGETQLNTHTKL
ncbi:hypothetical protein AVEN_235606-1 [Araneus ventricosus]|uniref:Uncharacterized protein n=1 Tax=Araneus ventricosus TaxID=182803 RepID=A0A4Y2BS98_ARAVE|nr:hypothetical protein AVEN_235606-1 [Araneus ventricosus]